MDWIKEFANKITSSQIARYLFSGGTATFTNLGVFYVLSTIFGLYYLVASGAAFLIGFAVSFTLHKFITFQDYETERAHIQAGIYLLFWSCNILFGMGLLYLFVEYAGVPEILGQTVTIIIVAVESYFVYRYLVFGSSTQSISVNHIRSGSAEDEFKVRNVT